MEHADADRTRVAPEIGSLHDEDAEADPARAREMERLQPWREQVTARGVVAAALIGFVFSVIVMKIALTTGLVPTLNISAALLAFLALRGWTRALERLGFSPRPFTRQENTVVQTWRRRLLHHSLRRWVRIDIAGPEQEDVRAGRELTRQCAREL
ncbi:hypothetical protein OsJ_07733 [Oryza sativa Japonica Group]|uniref:Uncharacterized protein n=1 Tax=Oryza sativa subsp. japonica TaxID=39947 RepID=A3A9L9_ORYSJ|nr:hypothetical protein OsJ_07733 [Oryza sativa Japonica Group]